MLRLRNSIFLAHFGAKKTGSILLKSKAFGNYLISSLPTQTSSKHDITQRFAQKDVRSFASKIPKEVSTVDAGDSLRLKNEFLSKFSKVIQNKVKTSNDAIVINQTVVNYTKSPLKLDVSDELCEMLTPKVIENLSPFVAPLLATQLSKLGFDCLHKFNFAEHKRVCVGVLQNVVSAKPSKKVHISMILKALVHGSNLLWTDLSTQTQNRIFVHAAHHISTVAPSDAVKMVSWLSTMKCNINKITEENKVAFLRSVVYDTLPILQLKDQTDVLHDLSTIGYAGEENVPADVREVFESVLVQQLTAPYDLNLETEVIHALIVTQNSYKHLGHISMPPAVTSAVLHLITESLPRFSSRGLAKVLQRFSAGRFVHFTRFPQETRETLIREALIPSLRLMDDTDLLRTIYALGRVTKDGIYLSADLSKEIQKVLMPRLKTYDAPTFEKALIGLGFLKMPQDSMDKSFRDTLLSTTRTHRTYLMNLSPETKRFNDTKRFLEVLFAFGNMRFGHNQLPFQSESNDKSESGVGGDSGSSSGGGNFSNIKSDRNKSNEKNYVVHGIWLAIKIMSTETARANFRQLLVMMSGLQLKYAQLHGNTKGTIAYLTDCALMADKPDASQNIRRRALGVLLLLGKLRFPYVTLTKEAQIAADRRLLDALTLDRHRLSFEIILNSLAGLQVKLYDLSPELESVIRYRYETYSDGLPGSRTSLNNWMLQLGAHIVGDNELTPSSGLDAASYSQLVSGLQRLRSTNDSDVDEKEEDWEFNSYMDTREEPTVIKGHKSHAIPATNQRPVIADIHQQLTQQKSNKSTKKVTSDTTAVPTEKDTIDENSQLRAELKRAAEQIAELQATMQTLVKKLE